MQNRAAFLMLASWLIIQVFALNIASAITPKQYAVNVKKALNGMPLPGDEEIEKLRSDSSKVVVPINQANNPPEAVVAALEALSWQILVNTVPYDEYYKEAIKGLQQAKAKLNAAIVKLSTEKWENEVSNVKSEKKK